MLMLIGIVTHYIRSHRTNFNTSHVNVNLKTIYEQIMNITISIHLMLMLIECREFIDHAEGGFQYISC